MDKENKTYRSELEEETVEKRGAEIDKVKTRNLEFIDSMIAEVKKRIASGDSEQDWFQVEKDWLDERESINELMDLGREYGILIDPAYYIIMMGLARRFGPIRAEAIKKLVEVFAPLEKLRGYLKE